MDANKVFADLTWDDVVIEHGVLKSIWEYPVKSSSTRIFLQCAVDSKSRCEEHFEGVYA